MSIFFQDISLILHSCDFSPGPTWHLPACPVPSRCPSVWMPLWLRSHTCQKSPQSLARKTQHNTHWCMLLAPSGLEWKNLFSPCSFCDALSVAFKVTFWQPWASVFENLLGQRGFDCGSTFLTNLQFHHTQPCGKTFGNSDLRQICCSRVKSDQLTEGNALCSWPINL